VDDSDSDTESAEKDASTRIRTSEEQPERECKLAKDFSTKGSSAKFNSDRASMPVGKPCISGEQLPMECPNWFHAGIADAASMAKAVCARPADDTLPRRAAAALRSRRPLEDEGTGAQHIFLS
jgi:hypothetical protein